MGVSRPERVTLTDELGRRRTLSSGPAGYTRLVAGAGPGALFLGLGPEPGQAAALVPAGTRVTYVECPEFLAAMSGAWREAVPEGWERVEPEDIDVAGASAGTVYVHAQGSRLFPSFWGPIRAAFEMYGLTGGREPGPERLVLLPGGEGSLLVRELTEAFEQAGFRVMALDPGRSAEAVAEALAACRPALFFSVNFRGLDDYGHVAALLGAAGVPVAAWCVDNPFHVLSRLKSPYWREVSLFVTDDWFVEPLGRHGARRVAHLPLAACGSFFGVRGDDSAHGRLLYVGRSAFPDRTGFFAGQRLDPADAEAARRHGAAGGRPDFAWWAGRLGLEGGGMWPGKAVRAAGLGAEESGLSWRGAVLRGAAATGRLSVVGDAGWGAHLPEGARLAPPVDYYGPLAGLYAGASAVVAATSFLLPRGLSQRHFDVWAAGGLLLTDATGGLGLFPEELVAQVRYDRPLDIAGLWERFERERGLRGELIRAFRAEIAARHVYARRVESVLEAAGLA